MKQWVSQTAARRRLKEAAAARKITLARLSRFLDQPDEYLSKWVREGKPEWLLPGERNKLARFLGIDADEIGWPDA